MERAYLRAILGWGLMLLAKEPGTGGDFCHSVSTSPKEGKVNARAWEEYESL
jgi:hypothetical protein